jgi:hypothetical protein
MEFVDGTRQRRHTQTPDVLIPITDSQEKTMTRPIHPRPTLEKSNKPMAMVGAGPLTSAIWKSGDEQSGWRYRFNLFRQLSRNGQVSQLFRPADLIHFVKLTQVLAAVLADDGCLTANDRRSLQQIAQDLDAVIERHGLSSEADEPCEPHSTTPTNTKGAWHGQPSDP